VRKLTCFGTASAAALAISCLSAGGAFAQTGEGLQSKLDRLEAQLRQQDRLLAEQQNRLDAQAQELERLRLLSDVMLDQARGAGALPQGEVTPAIPQPAPRLSGPVGAPPPELPKAQVAAVPEGYGVLTPQGRWVLEPSLDYSHSSSNRLVFRGIEIVTGVQIGVIEASDADRNSVTGAITARYGVADRLEVEARIPWVHRDDRITTLAHRDVIGSKPLQLEGSGLGDIEFAARYQVNRGLDGWPVFLAGLRAKSDTGTGPFDVARDEFAVATELATGSGFWGVEGSLSFLYPTDPIVIFGGLSYLAHLPKDIDKTFGDDPVERVDPGDSIGLNAGFGFALNPRFSFSLGYKHNYIYPTKMVIGGTRQESEALHAGAFTFGWSLGLTPRISLNNTYEIGTTADAPDARVVFRLPVRF
jgi:hypothetical protein